jgi:hypothetical protein
MLRLSGFRAYRNKPILLLDECEPGSATASSCADSALGSGKVSVSSFPLLRVCFLDIL